MADDGRRGQLIGSRLRRVEDPRLILGRGRFAADITRPGLLHAAFVRSPHAHALVRSIDTSGARRMPGVVAVFTAADLAAAASPFPIQVQAPGLELRAPSGLASRTIRFGGEAVAMVVAADERTAVDAADAVIVDFEPLPAVVDPIAATAPEAAKVHDDVRENRVGTLHLTFGDSRAAFASAAASVRRNLSVARSACAALETRGCVAEPVGPAGESGLTLTTSTQAPHNHRPALARIFDLPIGDVRVVAPDVGGGFGPKGRLYPEEVAVCAAALALARPIAWQADRSEDFATTYQGRGTVIDAELAADADGRLLALRAHVLQDCGAYLASGLMVPSNSVQHMVGPYHLAAMSVDVEGVYTHKAPLTPLRGGGREVGAYVIERMIDHLAREMELDPMELRRRNALHRDEFPYDTGYPSRAGGSLVYDSGDFPTHLTRAAELIGYDTWRRQTDDGPIRRGIALTLFIESTGFGGETARARLESDGTITLAVGAPSTGQGHGTVMAQVFGDRFGIPFDRIRYSSGDTDRVEQGVGTFGSRLAVTAGNASALAAVALKEKVLEAAEDVLEASNHDLELVDGAVQVKGYPSKRLPLSEISAARDGEALEVETLFESPGAAFAGGAHAAIVAVDTETGQVRVERYVVVHDCGTVINPAIVDGQVHGGVIHGIGNALGERMAYDDTGQLLTGSFASYQLAEVDALVIEVVHHETPSPNNPEGIKGAGEGGTIGALATIARAVEDALSEFEIEINELPIEPEWIVSRVQQASMPSGTPLL